MKSQAASRGGTLVAVLIFAMVVGFLASTLLTISSNRSLQSHRTRDRQRGRLAGSGALHSLQNCLDGSAPPRICPGWSDWQSCGPNCYQARRLNPYPNGRKLYAVEARWFQDGTLEIDVEPGS